MDHQILENRIVIKKIFFKTYETFNQDIKIKLYHNNIIQTSEILWDYTSNEIINWKFIFDYDSSKPISFLILDDELFNTDNILGQCEIQNKIIEKLKHKAIFEFPEPIISELKIYKEKEIIGTLIIEQYIIPKDVSMIFKCGEGWTLPDSNPKLELFPLKKNNEIYQHIKIVDDKFGIEDKNKFDLYSEAFSRIIDEPENKPPLCFGIIGPDNFGKTNFLHNLKNKLKEKAKYKNKYNPKKIIIEFNAWNFEADNTIWASLLINIHDALEKTIGSNKMKWLRIKKQLFPNENSFIYFIIKLLIPLIFIILLVIFNSQLSNIFSAIVGSIIVITSFLLVKDFISILNNILFTISNNISKLIQKPDWSNKLGFMNEIKNEFFDFLNPIIKNENIRLILMIDDLDRCSIEKIYTVIKALSLLKNSDCPIYIFFAYDSVKINEAINTYYKNKYHINTCEGKHLLEKLVNIPFCLPGKNIIENLSLIDEYLDEEYYLNLRNELIKKIPNTYKIYNYGSLDIDKSLESYYFYKFPNKDLVDKKQLLIEINKINIVKQNKIIINVKEDQNDDKLLQIEENLKKNSLNLNQLENYYRYLIKIEKDYNNISRINEIKNMIYIKFIHLKKDYTNNYYIGLDSDEIKTFQRIIEDTKNSGNLMNNYQVKKIINIYSIARFLLPKFFQNKKTILFHLIVITEKWHNIMIEMYNEIRIAKNNLSIQQIKDCFSTKDLVFFYMDNKNIIKNDQLIVYLSKIEIKVIDFIELEIYIFNFDRCLLPI